MKRVVLFAASAATLVQFTKNDLTALQTLGCEIHMICNLQKPNLSPAALHDFNQAYPKLVWHDLPFCDSIHRLRQNQKASQELGALLDEVKPDLLHCHGTIAGLYGRKAAEKRQIPVFYTAHDFRVYRGCIPVERLFFGMQERRHSKCTEVMFTVCPEDAAYGKKHLHAKKVVSLPDVGLDYEKYATPKRSRGEVRRELHIPEDADLMISVGTLRMQKRLRVVLQAMARLRELENLHYIICGEGPDMLFLQKLAQKLHLTERVHLLGYRTDIPDLLGAADIFCMPSRREGCGMAALEAMAAGLPLITVRSHGTKTYAEKGESAFCLKGDLVASCADAIAQLAENKLLRKQIGAHNRAAAKAFSDEGAMMQQMRTYYQEILS
ncbi:glycosyltransferase [Ruminococcus sp.]|uniref:glycosyltransferase n=1 Tax=Ruminococcus sp. TaxID=41978 RepID=UPI0025DDDC36|nr:glycosyltransferase [Ruminococcus sp.]